ncbi:MAG: ABC transporter substrate-binding protein [Candidatus Thorarchaeota archaeon]
MRKTKTSIVIVITLSFLIISGLSSQPPITSAIEPFFTLVAKTDEGGVRPDYINFLKQQVARIGINVDFIVQDWPTFVGELIAFRNFDICYVSLSRMGMDPNPTGIYNENGSLNIFGYNTDMDWNETLGTGTNEWYMKQGLLIMPPDGEERVHHYWAWEQYLMDKILPCVPLFAPQRYDVCWSNLVGYNISKGILQSWGDMTWDGVHSGQEDTSELVISDNAWSDLNPLFQDDSSSSFISKAIMNSLLYFDSDCSIWPHLAESYEMIDNTHFRIKCREGIKWQEDPDGLFPDEYFDARDVYFTYKTLISISSDIRLPWLDDLVIIDNYTIDFYIDSNPDTPQKEPYAPFIYELGYLILPEHYLNQTQLGDGVTPDICHSSWRTFAINPFGTGLFEFTDFVMGEETILTIFPDCWQLNESITNDANLNWHERFGDYSGGLNTLRIRIIDNILELYEFKYGFVDIISISDLSDLVTPYFPENNYKIQSEITGGFGFFGFNMRPVRPIIGSLSLCAGDPSMTIGLAVRKAIAYALDRAEINQVIHNNEMIITDYPINPQSKIWNNPNIIRYNHDLDLAIQYMNKIQCINCSSTPPASFPTLLVFLSIFTLYTTSIIIRKRKNII